MTGLSASHMDKPSHLNPHPPLYPSHGFFFLYLLLYWLYGWRLAQ